MMPELRQLECFLYVYEYGSFSAAAHALHLSQSTLSETIKRLEEELDCTLFERHAKGTTLTPAGQQLLGHAEAVITKVNAIRDTFHPDLASRQRDELHLGTVPGLVSFWLPEVFEQFHRKYPDTNVTVSTETAPTILELIRDGAIDVGIVHLSAGLPTHSDLVWTLLKQEEMVLVVSQNHPSAKNLEVPLRLLASESFILHFALRDIVDAICQGCSFHPKVVLEVGHMSLLCRLIQAELGVSIVAKSTTQLPLFKDLAVCRIGEFPTPHRTLAMVHRRTPASPPLSDLCALMKKAVGTDPLPEDIFS